MKLLVTGGAGYIGSHAVRQLLDGGHEVTVLDHLRRGHAEAVDPRACFVKGEIGDHKLLMEIFKKNTIDGLMHFAAEIEVSESVENPFKYYQNNFSSSLVLLNAARESGIRRVVFSSTAAVYGDPLETPISENHPRNPLSPYGRSKLMMEFALEDFRRAYGIGYAILRYFNVAGAHPSGQIGEDHRPESHLIPKILLSALRSDLTVPVYGSDYPTPDGTCIRDYVHVVDLAQAHLLALARVQPGDAHVFNLGSDSGYSVLEVIAACRRVTGREIRTEPHGRRPGDAGILIASSEKIRNTLGWVRAHPDLETIIAHAWRWHQAHPNGYEKTSPF